MANKEGSIAEKINFGNKNKKKKKIKKKKKKGSPKYRVAAELGF